MEVNYCVAITLQSLAYRLTIVAMLGTFQVVVFLICVTIYTLFIRLLLSDQDLSHMRFQVHTFYVTILVMQIGRFITALLRFCAKADYENLQSFNITAECAFNLLILYYFVVNS
jgi:uncharacterized membrane protein